MCKSPLHPFLHALPKCEQHLHLEGTLSPTLLFRLAAANHIALPAPTTDPAFTSPATLLARYARFTSLDDFLHYYFIGTSVLRTAADFEALAYEYLARAHADGVVHAELFFDPQSHTQRGVAYATVVQGFMRARARALEEWGLSSELILCFLRHLPVRGAELAFGEAEALGHFADGTVVGIGLDSSEVGYRPELFRGVYERAVGMGIEEQKGETKGAAPTGKGRRVRRTAHAGEEGDASYVRGALEVCGVERIDHGIRLVEDGALMKTVAERKILVTMCPISNVKLRCVKEIKELPIRTFLDNGVRFSINSDDPAYFGGYILDNYCAVQEAFGLTVAEWGGIAKAAVEGSWCGEARRAELMKEVEDCLVKFEAES